MCFWILNDQLEAPHSWGLGDPVWVVSTMWLLESISQPCPVRLARSVVVLSTHLHSICVWITAQFLGPYVVVTSLEEKYMQPQGLGNSVIQAS